MQHAGKPVRSGTCYPSSSLMQVEAGECIRVRMPPKAQSHPESLRSHEPLRRRDSGETARLACGAEGAGAAARSGSRTLRQKDRGVPFDIVGPRPFSLPGDFMGSRTPLFETHVASGAKIVDFGGWDMPLNYGSQIEEHHAVRRDAGMFDVSHMCPVDVKGRGCPRVPALPRRQQRRPPDAARQGAVRMHAESRRRRGRRPDHLLPARRLVPRRGQRFDRGQGHRVDAQGADGPRVRDHQVTAARPGHDRHPGPERAREVLAGASRPRRRRPKAWDRSSRPRSATSSSRGPATRARTASK